MNITKHCDDIMIHTDRGSLFNLAVLSAGRSLRPLSYSNSFMSRMQDFSYFSAAIIFCISNRPKYVITCDILNFVFPPIFYLHGAIPPP